MTKAAKKHEAECPWETGQLGTSVEHAEPASVDHQKMLDESLGLQLISIRLQKALIDDLKRFAEREGLGYQPLVRRILMRWVSHEYKMEAQERLATSMATPGAIDTDVPGQQSEEEYEPPMVACR